MPFKLLMHYQHVRCDIDMHDATLPWMMQYQNVWCNTETYLTYWHALMHCCYGYCFIIIDDAILTWIMQYWYGWCNINTDDRNLYIFCSVDMHNTFFTGMVHYCHGWCKIDINDAILRWMMQHHLNFLLKIIWKMKGNVQKLYESANF